LQKTDFINSLTENKKFLIDYANLIDNLFLHQNTFLNKKNCEVFLKKPYYGIPIIFPINLNYFSYKKKDNYIISSKLISKYIFNTKNKNYTPLRRYNDFGDKYSEFASPKNEYIHLVDKIKIFNENSKLRIEKLKKKFKKICAFQTRNIPHFGHERIIEYLLKKYDHVVVNPVIGPKKNGDIKHDILAKVFNFLIKKKYYNKVSYIPVIANMFYAGPREALHHANIRSVLGFNYFAVGRDHAGAENLYRPSAAFKMIKKNEKFLSIKIEKLLGAYYCKKCKKVVIKKKDCNHSLLLNISGSEFRKCIEKKIYFKYADKKVQNFIFKLKNKLFVS